MKQFLIFLAICAILGILIYNGVARALDPIFHPQAAQTDFAQNIALGLKDVANNQAIAIAEQAKAAARLAELNTLVERAQLERAQAETWLVYAGIVAITIAALAVIVLIILAVTMTMRGKGTPPGLQEAPAATAADRPIDGMRAAQAASGRGSAARAHRRQS